LESVACTSNKLCLDVSCAISQGKKLTHTVARLDNNLIESSPYRTIYALGGCNDMEMFLWSGDDNDWRLFDNPDEKPQGFSVDFSSMAEAFKWAEQEGITVIIGKHKGESQ